MTKPKATGSGSVKIQTALISVSDKNGIVEFARELSRNGVKLISSGGTYKALSDAGVKCAKVEDVTGFPEMLEGRVKTLHPKLHGGILARRNKEHLAQLKEHGIGQIDLVVVNLYPFQQTISRKGSTLNEAIENIDIGGPALIRAAAKNHESVGVVVEPLQYEKVLGDLKANYFALSEKMRKELMVEAYQHTAFYDSLVAAYFAGKYGAEKFPAKLALAFEKKDALRYGENPHQRAVLYNYPLAGGTLLDAEQLSGKELSFNNYLDADSAVAIVRDFDEPCAAIIKHANPCGVAAAKNISGAFRKALESDPVSAFGGIAALNRNCDLATARQITSFFNEVVIAPAFEKEALEELRQKKNLRVLELKGPEKKPAGMDYRHIDGGLLAQEKDFRAGARWRNASGVKCSKGNLETLVFAWKVARRVKSNAIVIAKDMATVGIGGGLTSRVDATELAIKKAGVKAKGSVLASDGFFPFKDSIELAAKAGIAAIAEPGGSVKDEEVIAEAKKSSISLFFTGARHFRH